MKILVADDDPDLLDTMTYVLRRQGFNVLVATDGKQALQRCEADAPDLVLLDVKMPRLSGFEICRQIRQTTRVPVIMVTGMGDEDHIIQGLRSGADDYVTKPFSPKQLVARIEAVLRRSTGQAEMGQPGVLQVGPYTLDLEAHQVTRGDMSVYLTPREFRILFMLLANEGRVVSFERLVEFTWGYGQGGATMLKTHVSHIRKKLKLEKGQPDYIRVVNGAGYLLVRS